jgi:hypothetical protein
MRRGLAVVVAMVAAAVVVFGARGGDVRGTDPAGDVKAPGLTGSDRAALDIRAVRVLGEEGLGVLVDVTFAGNVETAVGHGRLGKAVVGFVLRPKAGAGAPAGLITMGAEFLTRTVRISRSRKATYLVPVEKDLRRTRSASVGVVRLGRHVFFWVFGTGLSNVASVDARSFAALPRGAGRLLQQLPATDDKTWSAFKDTQPADEDVVVVDPSTLSTDQLKAMAGDGRMFVERLLKREGMVALAAEHVTLLLHDLGPNSPAAGALKSAKGALDNLNDQMVEEIRFWNGQITVIEQLIRDRQPPPEKKSVQGNCTFFDPAEVTCQATFNLTRGPLRRLAAAAPIDSIRVVVPASGATPRLIVKFLCPSQLPNGSNPSPYDTLTCSGGSLAVGATFTFNLRTYPYPTAGMGLQIYAGRNGVFEGPFTLSGP